MKKIVIDLLKRAPLLVWIGILTIACWAFATRMAGRNVGGNYRSQRMAVVSNWGSNVVQKSPSLKSQVYYGDENVNQIVSEEDKVVAKNVRVIDSRVNVNLNMDSRRKGLVYFPTFVTNFNATYIVSNESKKEVRANISFPLPSEGNLVWDVEVKAEDNSGNATIESEELSWSGVMKPGEKKSILVKYAARGLEEFSYSLAESKGLQNFKLAVTVNGADRIDFPNGALSPVRSTEDKENRKWNLEWEFNNVLTSPEIKVSTYAQQNISEQVAKLFWFAPLLLIGYTLTLMGLGVYKKVNLGTFDLMVTASLYTVFYPLLAYLVSVFEKLTLFNGLAIGSLVVSLILIYYYKSLFNLKFSLLFGTMVQIVFMVFFPTAMLIPQLTGFLSILGIIFILTAVVQARSK